MDIRRPYNDEGEVQLFGWRDESTREILWGHITTQKLINAVRQSVNEQIEIPG